MDLMLFSLKNRCETASGGLFIGESQGCEMRKLKLQTSRGLVLFEIWDTAGQEHLQGLRDGYFIGAQGAIVFFDAFSAGLYGV